MADPEYDDLFADEEETAASTAAEEEIASAKTEVTATYEDEPRQRVETPDEERTKTQLTGTFEEEPAPRKRTRTPAPKKTVAPAAKPVAVTPPAIGEPSPAPQPQDGERIAVRVVNDDITIAGRTFIPGTVVALVVGSPQYKETVGADGRSWLDLADDPEAQCLRWKRTTPLIEPVRG